VPIVVDGSVIGVLEFLRASGQIGPDTHSVKNVWILTIP
jgi:hypothetical protein